MNAQTHFLKNCTKTIWICLVCSLLLLSSPTHSNAQITPSQFGVSLCGPEFGLETLPGLLNKNYVYPRADEITYFNQKGIRLVQLPIRWERIQKRLGGSLDADEMREIKNFIINCDKQGLSVIINLHNFGRYRINNTDYIIGSAQVPLNCFKDVWRKLAFELRDFKNIYALDLMNEPHDMGTSGWYRAAQIGIEGIREADRDKAIMVEGEHYSNAECWVQYNDELKYLNDPSYNIIFNAHCYFDFDNSGRYVRTYDDNHTTEFTGIEKIKPFVDWLKKNYRKGFVGEFGVPKTDRRWLTVMENFLEYLTENNISGSYWAAGPWWRNYPLSIEPVEGKDQPQMNIYAKYINRQNNTGTLNAVLYRKENSVEKESTVSYAR